MRFPQVVMGGMYDEYIREREAFKERFRPAPASNTPTPPPASAPSAAGVDLANRLCAIFQAWGEEMKSWPPNQEALKVYQQAFEEAMASASEAERQSAPALLRTLCPGLSGLYSGFQARSGGGRPNARPLPLPPKDTRPWVPSTDPYRRRQPASGAPLSSLPPQGAQGAMYDPFRPLPAPTLAPAMSPKGQVTINPSTDTFWDGRQYRSSVSTIPSGWSPLFSMTGSLPVRQAPRERMFGVAGAMDQGVLLRRAKF